MLAAYYSKGADSRSLFENLKIVKLDWLRKEDAIRRDKPNDWKSARFEEHDVLFIDVASFISMADNIKNIVSDIQADVIAELMEAYPECVRSNTKSLLKALMQVNAKTGNKFFVIIDEWDAPFREAKDDEKLQRAYIQFLRSIFKSVQTSQIIVGAYMTGILPIKKYGTQSALTDFREFTMLEPGPLAPFIGFTEGEDKWMGHIYCPNSIMELISKKKFDSYWTSTETYESLLHYIDLNFDGLKDGLVDMLGGKRCKINVRTFQNDMTSIRNRDDVFTLLVHLGYLAYDSDKKEDFIPNEEVRVLLIGVNYSTKTGKHTCKIEEYEG